MDQTILFVLSRAAFGQPTALGDLWNAQRRVWWSQLPLSLTLRRLSPWRSFTQPVYQLEGLPQWYDGIGSFSREAVLDHARLIPDIEDRLVRTEVPCLTFDSLCAKHDVGAVDLLLIDTEGYDHQILAHINFGVHRPAQKIIPPMERANKTVPRRISCAERTCSLLVSTEVERSKAILPT